MSNFRLQFSSNILMSTVENTNSLCPDYQVFTFYGFQFSRKAVYAMIRVLILVLSILRIISRYYRDTIFEFFLISLLLWVILLVIAAVVMYHLIKVKEAMLCVRETWAVIANILILTIFNRIPIQNSYYWISILGVFFC